MPKSSMEEIQEFVHSIVTDLAAQDLNLEQIQHALLWSLKSDLIELIKEAVNETCLQLMQKLHEFHMGPHSKPKFRLKLYKAIIEELNAQFPERLVKNPPLHDTSTLSGMDKIRAEFVQFMTKTSDNSFERFFLGYSILIEKEKLGIKCSATSRANFLRTRGSRGAVPGDFSHLNLSHLYLAVPAGFDPGEFKRLWVRNSDFTGTVFRGFTMKDADFSGATLNDANLSEVSGIETFDLEHAKVKGAYLGDGVCSDNLNEVSHFDDNDKTCKSSNEWRNKYPYLSLFKTINGSVDADTKFRVFQLHVNDLITQLQSHQIPNLTEKLYNFVATDLRELKCSDAEEELFDGLRTFIEYDDMNGCTLAEKNAWIQTAILDWLWTQRNNHPQLKDANWFAEKQIDICRTIVTEAAKNHDAFTKFSDPSFYKYMPCNIPFLQREMFRHLRSFLNGDFSDFTRVGNTPKGILAMRKKLGMEKPLDSLQAIQAEATEKKSNLLIVSIFKELGYGRDHFISEFYTKMSEVDLHDEKSLKHFIDNLTYINRHLDVWRSQPARYRH